MADVLLLRKLRKRKDNFLAHDWRLKDYSDPFSLNESKFISRYRLSKNATKILCDKLRSRLQSYGFSVEMQVLNSLRILGTGSFQSVVGETLCVSQPFVSRCLDKFARAILEVTGDYIKFPTSNAEILHCMNGFFRKWDFPNVIGAIDCTHVVIYRPSDTDWFVYLNRKNKFTVNVQMICDAEMRVLDVVARWPGSTHDATIWQYSNAKQLIANNTENNDCMLLIGDSGYPLQENLMTPFLDVSGPVEEIFNEKHRTARNVIERTFGLIKSRFRMISESGGSLIYRPDKVCRIIMAAAVLHNICIMHNVPVDFEILNEEDSDIDFIDMAPTERAAALRLQIARRFQSAR